MGDIKDTVAYPITTPAQEDYVIGTDASDGVLRTVNFRFSDLAPLVNGFQTIAQISDWPVSVSATQVGYLSGVTGAIQAQLDGKAPIAAALPVGGSTGQILSKVSATPYDVTWIDPPSGGTGATNLSYTPAGASGTVASDTGTDAVIPAATVTFAGLFLPSEKSKLTGIATGATANAADATLLDRANHTGTQAISTIVDLQTELDELTLRSRDIQTQRISGGVISVEPGNLIGVSAGTGIIVDRSDPQNIVVTPVSWGAATVAPLLTSGVTFISVNAAGTVLAEPLSQLTGARLRTEIQLGSGAINESGTLVAPFNFNNSGADLYELGNVLGALNVSGNAFSGATGLTFQRTAGETWYPHISAKSTPNNPHIKTENSWLSSTNTFTYVWPDTSGNPIQLSGRTAILPGVFDNGTSPPGDTSPNGVVATNSWTFQVIYMEIEYGLVYVQFGNAAYATLDAARIAAKNFTRLSALSAVPIRCVLYVRGGATNLTLAADAVFEDTGVFNRIGGIGGGGGAGGGGEINTASNLGAGAGVFAQKVGTDLQFRSVVAGTGIGVVQNANDVTVSIGAHTHTIANVTGLQTALDGKLGTTATAAAALKLATARTIALSGDVAGSAAFDGSANVTITTAVADDSHAHTLATLPAVQTALNGKISSDVTGVTGAVAIANGIALSQADYDAILSPDANTLYVVI